MSVENPSSSSLEEVPVQSSTDWSKCVICQNATSEPLQCPADFKRTNTGAGYITLAKNIQGFKDLECLTISKDRLDEGEGIEKTLMNHRAS